MLLLESHLPINLEVLDVNGDAISGMAATLCHLDGEWATIARRELAKLREAAVVRGR